MKLRQYHLCRLAPVLIAAWLALIPITTAWAVSGVCRTDPIFFFGNGDKLAVVTTVFAPAKDLRELNYIVHAPPEQADDQRRVRVVEVGVPPHVKETTRVKFDLRSSEFAYIVEVRAIVRGDPVAVNSVARLRKSTSAGAGVSGEWFKVRVIR